MKLMVLCLRSQLREEAQGCRCPTSDSGTQCRQLQGSKFIELGSLNGDLDGFLVWEIGNSVGLISSMINDGEGVADDLDDFFEDWGLVCWS